MRDRNKSKILADWKKKEHLSSMFLTSVPFIVSSAEVVIDFLKFLHEPTPPDILNYATLAAYYWKHVIMKYGFNRGAALVTIVIDKQDFLPPIRQAIHNERKKKGKKASKQPDLRIGDAIPALHGTEHANALQNPAYKKRLITYLKEQFIKLACENKPKGTLILDCLQEMPLSVTNGHVQHETVRSNTKGEADNAIFTHVHKSPCKNILIVASDTDITMYGLAALESMTTPNKNVVIEKNFKEEYIWFNYALV